MPPANRSVAFVLGNLRRSAPGCMVRFSFARWVLAPRTTWQARRLAAAFGDGMDARTAWAMARLARHPEERLLALAHLDRDRSPATSLPDR
ncbi:hypothetical protein ABT160_24460 [Streptomyces sp. NPDC001941]|uniref:hypothetical protein n=1 Tax=Streptomyces sp. NPDC001941 TaxID=3154659 RepID=UPI003318ACB4